METSVIFTSGGLILTAGAEPTGVYIVMDGVVSIMNPTDYVILVYLSQGDSFWWSLDTYDSTKWTKVRKLNWATCYVCIRLVLI